MCGAAMASLLVACDTAPRAGSVVLSERDAAALDTAWLGPAGVPQLGEVDEILALPSGELIVADVNAGSVALFGPDGQFRRSLITRGAGPAEAEPPFVIALEGDTLFVTGIDPGARVLTWLNLRDSTSGRVAIEAKGSSPLLCGANAFCLARPGPAWRPGLPFSAAGQSERRVAEIGWIQRGPQPVFRSLARLQGPLVVSFEWPAGPAPIGAGTHEFAPGAVIAANAHGVWALDDSSNALLHWPFGGAALTRVSLPTIQRATDWNAIADTTESLIARARTPLAKSRLRATRDPALVRSADLPIGSRLVLGRAGHALIQVFADGEREVHYYLAVADGRVARRLIAVPGDIALSYVDGSVVVGAVSDDEGVSRLISLRLPPEAVP